MRRNGGAAFVRFKTNLTGGGTQRTFVTLRLTQAVRSAVAHAWLTMDAFQGDAKEAMRTNVKSKRHALQMVYVLPESSDVISYLMGRWRVSRAITTEPFEESNLTRLP